MSIIFLKIFFNIYFERLYVLLFHELFILIHTIFSFRYFIFSQTNSLFQLFITQFQNQNREKSVKLKMQNLDKFEFYSLYYELKWQRIKVQIERRRTRATVIPFGLSFDSVLFRAIVHRTFHQRFSNPVKKLSRLHVMSWCEA